MSDETISVSPALLWRLRVLCLTWQTLGQVMVAFQVRADRLVVSLRFVSLRSLCVAVKTPICAFKIILAGHSAMRSYERLFAEVEMASSKEGAMRAAGTDKIRAQSGPPLPNIRQEAFAQRIAAGCSATAAYASAYGRPRDASSRVNGRRLLTNANIRARIVQIQRDAALSSLSTIREVLDEAGRRTVDRIRNGSFKQACEAANQFADTVLILDKALSQQS